ncbi:metalloprotease m41 ftsh [Stylonychia lemnae]|uniref:Metalloprotease m41 ftsh n=1 Tax=Stylonychia lemnae TaxID=5949 RepID=A0A078B2E8_STYLE|nr:metalloprotease m41 ftsh [Stylonychia lemnae]|eukprot:CDW88406.1 metalloprotease m41 ftsh [Stylonychia lemnae]
MLTEHAISADLYFRIMKAITGENVTKLLQYQHKFEQNPQNIESAFYYFRELNRNGHYPTVVRLYNKHELSYSISNQVKYFDKIRQQYEYAKENIESLRKNSGSNEFKSLNLKENLQNVFITKFFDFIKKVIFVGVGFFAFTMIFKQFDNKSFMENYKFDVKKAKDIPQKLSDVRGIDEIKEEVENLIKMLKEPERYHQKGANLHKGVLLYGQPGTGKTLLARSIAGEAGCQFIYCTGSHFDEMFVGVGAKRIRELFNEAKKHKPCIIFIDEIDTLLSKSRRFNSEHSSSRATINQLLTEMDGFEKTENIMIIGATNHEDALDPAAVRPGRFDKKIHVPLPDVNGREDIFNFYLGQIEKSEEISAKKLAQMTPGFSGAEIENLVNTAITEAVHIGKDKADLADFEYARDRIMMGIERRKLSMSDRERLNTAIHEAGHAIACYFSKGAKKLYKATIVARGSSLGATYMVPEDTVSMTKEKILAEIDVAMGGHVAEKLIIGENKITSGCSNDLQGATSMAYRAVRYFGMYGESAGFIASDPDQTSEKYNAMIDKQVKEILDVSPIHINKVQKSFERVSGLILNKERELRELAKNLFYYDYLDADEIKNVIEGKKLSKDKVRKWEDKDPYIIKF